MARADQTESRKTLLENLSVVAWVALCAVANVLPASADVEFYLAPQFGISGLDAKADGQVLLPSGLAPLAGKDHDASPLIGLGVGLELPMNEVVPREWLEGIRLPTWPLRFELEAAGLREFELRTNGSGSSAGFLFSEIKATTLVANAWMDVPLITIWQPFQYVFGLGRQPRLRRWLEPGSFYIGSGIGFAATKIKTTDNLNTGNDDSIDFAWNVGTGINYSLTDRVSLSAGYRYLGIGTGAGSVETDLIGPNPNGKAKFDLQVHEFRLGIKIKIFSFRGVWR